MEPEDIIPKEMWRFLDDIEGMASKEDTMLCLYHGVCIDFGPYGVLTGEKRLRKAKILTKSVFDGLLPALY